MNWKRALDLQAMAHLLFDADLQSVVVRIRVETQAVDSADIRVDLCAKGSGPQISRACKRRKNNVCIIGAEWKMDAA